ncbi:MAG: acetate--CoA ligase alpha subunit [Bacillota bacterium]
MTGLDSLFNPAAVAVIGASANPQKIGHAILDNIIKSGYPGALYPVNPREKEILGRACYPSLEAVAGPVETAVLSVPPGAVLAAAEACGQKGVKNLVVITAGFKEVGKEGLDLERQLTTLVRRHGMRMVGPNCLGVMDTHTPINATFARNFPLRGHIGFISQSGALCVAILDWSLKKGVGFSRFISLGNKADLNEADFIADAAADPNTRVVVCYLEDVADGPAFLRAAHEASRTTPVVILKSGTSMAGAQAASSHTGALAGSDVAYEVAFRQAGVLRARSMTELFDLAAAFATQPVPKGKRVAIVTNSGGPGIITTDQVELSGLEMARFQRETIESLRSVLPPEANFFNPVDVIGDADHERYRAALERVLADEGVDAAIVLLSPTAVLQSEEAARVIIDKARAHPDKPVVAAFMGGGGVEAGASLLFENGIPCYAFPEPAVASLAGLNRYRQLRDEARTSQPWDLERVNEAAVWQIFTNVKRDNRVVLLGPEAAQVAEIYGIAAAPSLLATTVDEAETMARRLGYPVVMKIASPAILHKTDVGGVKVGLNTPEEVRKAFVDIIESVHQHMPRAQVYGVEVQKLMPKGIELIVGMTKDVQFGPLIAFGLGGIYVNLLKDVSFRLAHGLSRAAIQAMIDETKAQTLLRGFRGAPPADLEAVMELIARVARLVRDFPEITELDMNPVLAYPRGVSALDIKITIS